jgi:hypothetical protein
MPGRVIASCSILFQDRWFGVSCLPSKPHTELKFFDLEACATWWAKLETNAHNQSADFAFMAVWWLHWSTFWLTSILGRAVQDGEVRDIQNQV